MAEQEALILAGGFGVRLTDVHNGSKGFLDVEGGMIVVQLIEGLERAGLEIVILSNERDYGEYQELLEDRDWTGVRLVSNKVEEKVNSPGAIPDLAHGLKEIEKSKDVLVLPCDTVLRGTLDLGSFVKMAKKNQGVTVVGRRESRDKIRGTWGNLAVDDEGRVTEFVEKPEEPISDLAAAAIYYIPASERQYVEEMAELVVEGKENGENPGRLVPFLLKKKERKVFVFVVDAGMVDVGTPEDLKMVQ